MRAKRQLKIFKKPGIEYLKALYNKGVFYLFDSTGWKSASKDGASRKSRVLKYTKKSLRMFGDEMNIFKAPVIVGLKIIYYRSIAFVFENNCPQPQAAAASEDNFLYRDLSSSNDLQKQELKIFKYPTIDNLKVLYNKSIGKL
jgi:hypothetical protein